MGSLSPWQCTGQGYNLCSSETDFRLSPRFLLFADHGRTTRRLMLSFSSNHLLERRILATFSQLKVFTTKSSIYSLFLSGFICIGIPYRPPAPDVLLNSTETQSGYQVSQELKEVLREEVKGHYNHYAQGSIGRTTIPIYLFVSGAGTGKSRNAAEFSNTIYKCFDGAFFRSKK